MKRVRVKRGYIQNELSEERTEFSNERTLLSYIQTSLAIFAFAFLILRFFDGSSGYIYAGIFAIVLGVIIIVFGFLQYRKRQKLIKKFKKKYDL